MNELETFMVGVTLPERWKKKLEEEGAKNKVFQTKTGNIQDAIRVAIATMYFPEECEVTQ
jgi:hypothetical protein